MFKPFPCREITCLLPILLIISGIWSLWMFMLMIMIKRILLLLLYCYVYCSNYHPHQHHPFILPSCSRFLSIPLFTFTFHYSSTHVEIFLLILFKRLKMWITKRIFMQSENVKCTHTQLTKHNSLTPTYIRTGSSKKLALPLPLNYFWVQFVTIKVIGYFLMKRENLNISTQCILILFSLLSDVV